MVEKLGKKSKKKNKEIGKKEISVKLTNLLIYFLIGLFCVLFNKNSPIPANGPRWILLILSSTFLPLIVILKYYKKLKKVTLKFTFFHLVIILFFFWFSASRFWAVDKANFVEEWIRHSALILILLFFTFYAKKLNSRTLIYMFAFITTLISILGMLQFYGLDGNLFQQTALPASTFVNKNLATPLLSFLLPFLYFPILFVKDKKAVITLTVGLSISFSYLFIAATRSSWLGVTFSVFIFIIFLLNRNIRTKFTANIINLRFLYILSAFLLMFLLIKAGDLMKNKPFMSTTVSAQLESALRFKGNEFKLSEDKVVKQKEQNPESKSEKKKENKKISIIPKEQNPTLVNNSSKSIRMRIAKWRNSFEIVKKYPLLGIGLGSFDAVYPLYHSRVFEDEGYEGGFFHGGLHNDIYQYLVELGFIGLLIYIFLLFFVFRMLLDIFKTELSIFEYLFYLSALIGLVGLLTDSFFNYPLRYPSYLFIFAIIVGKIYSKYFQIKDIKYIIKLNLKKYLQIFLIVFVILCGLSINISHKKNLSEKSFKQATIMESKGKLDRTWYHMKQAIEHWPYKSLNLISGTAICYENYKAHKTERNYKEILKYNNMAITNLPFHFIPNFIRVNLFIEKDNWKRVKDINKYIDLLLAVKPKGNRSFQTIQTVAYLFYLKGEYEISLEYYKELIKSKPNNKDIKERIKILKQLIAENNKGEE